MRAYKGIWFPIMLSGYNGELKETYGHIIGPIYTNVPWPMLAAHEDQAQRNHSQSLLRLAERGGLSACEACAVLEDRPHRSMTLQLSYSKLAAHVAAWNSANAEQGDGSV